MREIMRLVGKTPNKALKTDAIDSAPVAHGFAILCTTGAPLLRRLAWRYVSLGDGFTFENLLRGC